MEGWGDWIECGPELDSNTPYQYGLGQMDKKWPNYPWYTAVDGISVKDLIVWWMEII